MSRIQNTKIKKLHDEWCKENGYKPQAASDKPEDLHAINTKNFIDLAEKDTSRKLQAPSPSSKRQASSRKRQAP